jgi:hypothetical protein
VWELPADTAEATPLRGEMMQQVHLHATLQTCFSIRISPRNLIMLIQIVVVFLSPSIQTPTNVVNASF